MIVFISLFSIFFIPSLFAIPSTPAAPSVKNPLTFETKQTNIAGQSIIRSTPILDGIATEGIDDLYHANDSSPSFFTDFSYPAASFRLNAAECVERALSYQSTALIKNPYIENINGTYEPVWVLHFEELRPAFKIRMPTFSILDLKDIYIDAETGDLLRIDDVVQLAQEQALANLFVYSPIAGKSLKESTKPVILKNLIDVEENGFLRGEFLSVKTCCKYFTCPDTGPCPEAEKKCAYKSHKNAQSSRELLNLPTDTLGLNPLLKMPEIVTVDSVRCTYLPFAKASYKINDNTVLGFFAEPHEDHGPSSEMDGFSEIQVYFSMMSFFNHIRSLLDDPTWCLREQAMSCDAFGRAVKDAAGNPKNPYRVFVNQLIPDMKISSFNQDDPDSFISQFLDGRGGKENPIKLDQFTRFGNAAFVPALSTLKKNTPRADEILSDLIKPFDHNVFFQGDKDFAYDGDVVFHEFMHAITTSLINKINTLGLDQWGIHSEPGSLNEAWSDYFAASFTNEPIVGQYATVQDGFAENSMRGIDNNATCPDDIIGESHHDGLIWSGALWEIRNELLKTLGQEVVIEFDRAVLASLAQATITEDFKTQSAKLVKNILSRPALGNKASHIASAILEKRGLSSCFRAVTLSTVDEQNNLKTKTKDYLLVPSKNQIGLKNYAPSTSQLEIGIPAGAKSLKLSWHQYLAGNGALLGTEANPNITRNIAPIKIITSLDVPIFWKFKAAKAIPTRLEEEISDEPLEAVYVDNGWQIDLALNFEPCAQKVLYASFLSTDFKYVLENISVTFEMDKNFDSSACNFNGSRRVTSKDPRPGCSTVHNHDLLGYGLLALFAIFLRHKTRRPCAPSS